MLLHDIQLTVVHLDEPPYSEGELAGLLSAEECDRAARFRFPYLQRRFRLGRGMLRMLLSHAASVPPDALEIIYSSGGKPALRDLPSLQFNVSHSGDLWGCAISRRTPVGLDIEQTRSVRDRDNIARRFFTAAECEAVMGLAENHRDEAFYRCWTRKEAYLKGLGEGLARGLATFTVSCGQEEISAVNDRQSAEPWLVQSFVPAPGYLAALAVPGSG